jgi:SAM-dependent methyltransferase
VSATYGDVDGGPSPGEAVEWQERIDRWPAVRAYRRASVELVAGAGLVVDVGCGPGLSPGAWRGIPGVGPVVGVDRSWVMVRRAAERGLTAWRGDAHALPLRDGAAGACRADRVLQHLPDPERALAEMVRVTRPGGRVVVVDPDQETLAFHVPGVDRALSDRVKALRRDVGYRNGRLASSLPHLLRRAGLRDVTVAAFPLVVTDPDEAFGLPGWPRLWRDRGIGDFTAAELDAWGAGMAQGRRDGITYAVTFFLVTGTRTPTAEG